MLSSEFNFSKIREITFVENDGVAQRHGAKEAASSSLLIFCQNNMKIRQYNN